MKRKRLSPENAGTIKLARTGTLEVRVSGNYHCGHPSVVRQSSGAPHSPVVEVRYELILECENRLNKRGFLVDQVGLHEALVLLSEEGTTESCELLAQHWGARLLEFAYNNNSQLVVHSMSLALRPFPFDGTLTAVFK